MTHNLITVRWFHDEHQKWFTDYINADEEHLYVVSETPVMQEGLPTYKFLMPRHMAKELYVTLHQIMCSIFVQINQNKKQFRVINIGLNSNEDFISGSFNILPQHSVS